MTTIDVIIATHEPTGIRRVESMNAPHLDGVRYIVSWQNHGDAPVGAALSQRTDMEIHRFDKSGLSRNRNNAIAHTRADVIVVLDDDVTIFSEGIQALQNYYQTHPEVDLVTFRSHPSGRKIFPESETKLVSPLPKGYYGTSFEMSFRRRSALHFCTELGLGSGRYDGGEDEALLLTAIRRGLNCRFIPVTVCAHMHDSTGTKARFSPGNLSASGIVIRLQYPYSAWLRVPLKAWRVWRSVRAPFLQAFWYVLKGAVAAPFVRRRNRDALW